MYDVQNPGAGSTAHGAVNADCWTTKSKPKYTPDRHREQPFDLCDELRIARRGNRADEILVHHGVTDPSARQLCGLAKIVRMGRFFEFHPDGEYAVIVPVIDVYYRELVDLLALDPREPSKWWYRDGAERLLDGDALGDQHLGKPLHIFKTPLSWLIGRCDGIVIFDINRAFIDLKTAPNGIVGEDDDHTNEIRRAMAKMALGQLPRFLTRIAA